MLPAAKPTIVFNLPYSSSLGCMVPAGTKSAQLPDSMADEPGYYIILNDNYKIQNRYTGTSTKMASRFNQRLQVVAELGISRAFMASIFAIWGDTQAEVSDQGLLKLNLEYLLIRFVMVVFFPHTVSNSTLTEPYINPTSRDIIVTLKWGGGQGSDFKLGQESLIWLANPPDKKLEFSQA